MLRSVGEAADAEFEQALLALGDDEVVRKGSDIFERDISSGGDELLLLRGVGEGAWMRRNVRPVSLMRTYQLPAWWAASYSTFCWRGEDGEGGGGLVGGEVADLAGDGAVDLEEDEGLAAGFGDFDGEALVDLVVDLGVGRGLAEGVAEDLVGALGGVDDV